MRVATATVLALVAAGKGIAMMVRPTWDGLIAVLLCALIAMLLVAWVDAGKERL